MGKGPSAGIRGFAEASGPAVRTLLLAARSGVPFPDEIRSHISNIANWAELHAVAAEHGVRPLLHRALGAVHFAGVPSDSRHALEEDVRLLAKQSLAFAAELLHVLEILEGEEMQACPYKGPVTALQAFGDIGLREFMDLDFMVRQRDVRLLTETLRDAGYPPLADAPADTAAEGTATRIPGQYHFARPPLFLPLEFHTEQTMRYYPVPIDLDRLSKRMTAVSINDRPVPVFAPELSLTILSVHGGKHLWNRLQWIADIAWLTARPNFDWDSALRDSRELHSEKMTLTGLALASELLGATVPAEIEKRVRGDRDVQSLALKSAREVLHPNRARANVIERAAFRIRSAPTRAEGFRHLVRLATAPTEEDRARAQSDASSAIMRPLRLAKKYGVTKRPAKTDDLGPFVPAPLPVIDAMLDLASPHVGDVLYDLGSGDGSIVFHAAKKHSIQAHGFEIDAHLVARAEKQSRRESVGNLVHFQAQDAKSVDLSPATIVTLFLSVSGNLLLLPRLRAQLRPGARVVSARFDLPGWIPEATRTIEVPGEKPWRIFLWRVT